MRCSSAVKNQSSCPFYCKLRRSNKDNLWYVCAGNELSHICEPEAISYKLNPVNAMMAARLKFAQADYEDDMSSEGSRSPKRKLNDEDDDDESDFEDRAIMKRLSIDNTPSS